MSTAGFTYGGFYQHVHSKADLMAETAPYSFTLSNAQLSDFNIVSFVQKYLSREYRDTQFTAAPWLLFVLMLDVILTLKKTF